MNARLSIAQTAAGVSPSQEETLTIEFCEMIKKPTVYFEKTIRLKAIFEQATEGQYLTGENCKINPNERIGVDYVVTDERQRDLHNKEIDKIRSIEYGSRAVVKVIGTLRNLPSTKPFTSYRYRFDLIRFEEVSHRIIPYGGELQTGTTYLGTVRGDGSTGFSLVPPLSLPQHYAVRIEWTNLNKFPELKQLGTRERRIIFSVLSDEVKQMTERRWNRTLRCKVIKIELT